MTTKARIETVRMNPMDSSFTIQVTFPGFTGPAGDYIAMDFVTTLEEYQSWMCPDGVEKTPCNYVEYRFIRPTYNKLVTVHGAIAELEGKEYDW